MSDLTSQDMTAIASLVVAVMAMITTAWQAALTRNHNRKSTTPILTFHGDHREGVQILIRNDGVGPALLKEVRYFVDSKCCTNINEFDAKLAVPPDVDEYLRSEISLPATIGVGQSILLLTLKGKNQALIDSLISRADFQLFYESVYGEHFDSGRYST